MGGIPSAGREMKHIKGDLRKRRWDLNLGLWEEGGQCFGLGELAGVQGWVRRAGVAPRGCRASASSGRGAEGRPLGSRSGGGASA